MHHFGLGLPKDYHLSKRFYDAAAEKSAEGAILCNNNDFLYFRFYLANLPSTIALFGLALSLLKDLIEERDLDFIFGESWDVWLISILCGLLSCVFLFRLQNRR